ncbi:MAG: hypothetical protein GY832_05085, partial [Chloroflexi bacterium]|nr:hypothetical protein [Chloroflexota bacterium]
MTTSRRGVRCRRVGLVVVVAGLWMVILAPAPLLAPTETEARSLGWHRFLTVRKPDAVDTLPMIEIGIAVCVPTDCHRVHRPDLLITSASDAAPVRSLAVSPWSGQWVHWLVSLGRGRWNAGWGVGGGGGVGGD